MALKKSLIVMLLLAISAVILFFLGAGLVSKENVVTVDVVTVDGSVKYQEIEGFGGSGAYYEALVMLLKEPSRTKVLDLLFSDLGISIYRLRVWTDVERVNDDADPNNFNWDAFRFSIASDRQIWNAQQAKERGVTKFMASVWSPPGWMKNTGEEKGGGYLLPEMYEEFAEFLAAYIIGYKNRFGIDIGWISLQNEPDFSTEKWETCTYAPEQIRELIKVVGAKFRAEGLSTKIMVPETAGCSGAVRYIPFIMYDPEAAQYVEVFAHHLYDVSFFNPDEEIPQMETIAGYSAQFNRPVWQTEYSCSEDANIGTFKEALTTAHHIHNVLTIENASAYFVWDLFWYMKGGLISINPSDNSYRVNPTFYAVKQYSEFITPGSRRIYAASNIQKILVSAYLNEADNHVTIVIINKSQDTVNMKINLKNVSPLSFKQYRTSKSENCAYVGDITVSNNLLDVTVPPESITTLFG